MFPGATTAPTSRRTTRVPSSVVTTWEAPSIDIARSKVFMSILTSEPTIPLWGRARVLNRAIVGRACCGAHIRTSKGLRQPEKTIVDGYPEAL